MIHYSLPQTKTPEGLSEWIKLNKVDSLNHMEEIPFTDQEIADYEHQSSLASRALDKLQDLLDMIKETIKKGTPYNIDKKDHDPVSFTIPPTKGTDAIKSNREFADQQIVKGYREEITTIYLIPNPEESQIVAVDIVGEEWSKYSRAMTADEKNQYKPLLAGNLSQAAKDLRNDLAKSGMTITEVDLETNTVHIEVDDKKRRNNEPFI
jgi:hypothetical protein